jgi:hypothetical protein
VQVELRRVGLRVDLDLVLRMQRCWQQVMHA